jgi:hypothetical protein
MSRNYLPEALRQRVIETARHFCGYCLTAEDISGAQMQIEHIIPLAQGGTSDEENLWLACAWCNSHKGAQTRGIDPDTGTEVNLFNPRAQIWAEHFRWSDTETEIIGRTPCGRATVATLRLNNEYIVPARRNWIRAGWHPPQSNR